jgi:hypothetical protein
MSDEDRTPPEAPRPFPNPPGPGESFEGWTALPPPPPLPPPRTRVIEPLPHGFWRCVDHLLQHSDDVVEMLRRGEELPRLSRMFFLISVAMAGLYGAVMGATNLLQGSTLPINLELAQIAITAIKVPVLYLLTLLIVFPPIYVSNAFVGGRFSFHRMFALLISSVAISVTILASMATVAFFFALTTRSYDFIKLLHVLFFVYSGAAGLDYLRRCVHEVSTAAGRKTPLRVFAMWLLLYMFVGTQLAWVLRPFVGSPNEQFQVFRPRSGNFYESVMHSLNRFLTDKDSPPVVMPAEDRSASSSE